jgi:hypothetical protein
VRCVYLLVFEKLHNLRPDDTKLDEYRKKKLERKKLKAKREKGRTAANECRFL